MTEQEQNLLDAAREIVYDFNHYGEVLQIGDNGEYGTESSIGLLNAAIQQYKEDTPIKDQPSESDKVKSLAQYLFEHDCEYADVRSSREYFQQALDAYESTEGVVIKIIKKKVR